MAGRLRLNPAVRGIEPPPIPTVYTWADAYDGARGELLDFSQAAPGYPMAEELRDALGRASRDPALAGYGPIVGETVLREVYAAHVGARYGAALTAANIQITSGCNQAFFAAMLCVAAPGDAAVLPGPVFFNHRDALAIQGVQACVAETRADDGFQPTRDAIEALIAPETRAVVLVSPNNPTGAVYSDEALGAIFDLCRERGLWLVIDETYRDFPDYPNGRPHGLMTRPGWDETLIQLYSFSKAYCIPGHRLGAIAAHPDVVAETEKVIDNLQICAPRPIQHAVAGLIEPLAEWRAANRREIAARSDAMAETFAALSGWTIDSLGAYFAYVRHPFAGRSSAAVARALAEQGGVVTLPGAFFGAGQEAYLRVAFANADVRRIRLLQDRLRTFDPAFPGT